jgi:Flp pilus assembly protein TadD
MRFCRKLMPALLAAALGGCSNLESITVTPGDSDRGNLEGNPTRELAPPGEQPAPAVNNEARNASLNSIASDLETHGENETALALYRQNVMASPDDPDANIQYGDACMRAGKTATAIAAYRTALGKSPDNADAEVGLGSALVKQGDLNKGLELLAKAAPRVNSAAAYNRLAIAQMLAGQPEAAEASFASAKALTPNDLDIGTNLALVAALADHKDAALAAVKEVAASPTAEPRQRRDLVMVLGLLGREGEARQIAGGDLSQQELHALLARAKSIRALRDPTARAKALGIVER